MQNQIKIKFIILVAIIIPIALFGIVGFQLFKINQTNKKLHKQEQQIELLQEQLDYYENKAPSGEHDSIGE